MEPRLPRPRDELLSLRAPADPAHGAEVRIALNEWPEPVSAERYLSAEDLRELTVNRYPVSAGKALREALARAWDVEPREVLVGNGSMEILLDTFLAYGGPGRTLLLFNPTYALYPRIATVVGMRVASELVGLPYALDAGRVREAIARHRPHLVVFCSPNNPTGNAIDDEAMLAAAEAAPDALVLVDEAYAEYAGTTLVPRRAAYPNLAIGKTLSKVRAAAGLRVGALIADPRVLEIFDVVRLPWTIDPLAARMAARIAADDQAVRDRVVRLRREREVVVSRLSARTDLEVFPTDANFVLIRPRRDSARRLRDALVEQGVLVRDVSGWTGADNCLRATIGTPEENGRFLVALERALETVPAG